VISSGTARVKKRVTEVVEDEGGMVEVVEVSGGVDFGHVTIPRVRSRLVRRLS
jgi:hypothetical protein